MKIIVDSGQRSKWDR